MLRLAVSSAGDVMALFHFRQRLLVRGVLCLIVTQRNAFSPHRSRALATRGFCLAVQRAAIHDAHIHRSPRVSSLGKTHTFLLPPCRRQRESSWEQSLAISEGVTDVGFSVLSGCGCKFL
uniref:Uncharacterized protein n=1 Tax=Noctiluca scintillans TaxID=2966 RepID=A0A7S1AV61_NOCSC|mmetsp:Transcript_60952/g.161872  ORF Transcript_60952/g.161872 Transcript_60952/m.161872 type:complete len:120 (+) Transcript_60952:711-1070(+)